MSPIFPVYQIDFAAAAAGKRVAATKRRIRWRFGFPNKRALEAGQTGTDCRGEEHDVTIIWSIASGKRQISMDGREIHYSMSRAGILDFSWSTKGNHVIKVICHAAPPMSATPGFRQYDLLIDGQSYFRMPKVYELGIKGPIPSHARVPGGGPEGYSNPTSPISMGSGSRGGTEYYTGPSTREQEEEDLKKAIQASMQETGRNLDDRSTYTSPGQMATADLLDFGAPAPSYTPSQPPSDARSVSSMPSYYSAPPSYNAAAYQSPPPNQPPADGALVPSHGPPGSYYVGAPPPTTPSYASQPNYATPGQGQTPVGYNSPPPVPPAPAPTPAGYYGNQPASTPGYYGAPPQNGVFGFSSGPEDDPFAPKPPPPPPKEDLSTLILSAYTSPSGSSGPQTPGSGPGASGQQANGYSPGAQPGTVPISMNGLTITEEEEPKSEFESALNKLVNFDHIDQPAEGEVKLTMIKKEEAKKAPKGKSQPLPPKGSHLFGQNASLKEVKENSHESTLKRDTEGILRAPPPHLFTDGAANAGALVVHGQGPPSLHQPQGFGVGALLPNGGFNNPQRQLPVGYQHQQYR